MTDSALETAMKENFDKAVDTAIEEAKKSEEYRNSFDEAMAEAKKEIDLWFNANELYDYSDLNEKYTR